MPRITSCLMIGLLLLPMASLAARLDDPTRPKLLPDQVQHVDVAASHHYQLSAILIRGGQRSATINGQTVIEGQSLGQATVSRIEPDRVVLQDGEQQQVLRLYTSNMKKVLRKAP